MSQAGSLITQKGIIPNDFKAQKFACISGGIYPKDEKKKCKGNRGKGNQTFFSNCSVGIVLYYYSETVSQRVIT